MEGSQNQSTVPMSGHNRHIQFFLDLDSMLAEESAKLEELHRVVETNGVEASEEQLVWEAFGGATPQT